ncbi:MAG: B12-binding domain-containing radical SAM protein [Synergistaceae bacterium]|jgi:radical SAM superfamily enzyme YgiQ (UPF0313 family)|nr:B12-binding domain-containing radical SAM protein [Synergistaceae bacterium]
MIIDNGSPKTLLVNPNYYSTAKDGIWDSVSSIMPPLGLAWLAAMLEEHGFEVSIKDFMAERNAFNDDVQYIKSQNYDYLGITSTTPQIKSGLLLAQAAKEANPDAVVILGGVHPTVMTDEVLVNDSVDIVVRGEGEKTLLDIVLGKPYKDIQGISYKNENMEIVHNVDRSVTPNLDDLPDPAYHLLPMEKYFPAVGAYKKLPAVSMLGTRGCPGQCTYCHRQLGKKVRTRSGKRIAAEAKMLHDKFGINEINFYDDTFTTNHKEVFAFIETMKEYNLSMSWVCFSRVDSVDYPLLKAMAESGCHQIMFGVESANKEILRNIKKGINMDVVTRAIKDAQKAGIDVRVSLMIGNPGETRETVMESMSFISKVDPDLLIYNVTTPYPGTEMFKWADENGFLLTKDWDKYDLRHSVMELPTISNKEIDELYSYAYKKFYRRPSYILKRLKMLRSINDFVNAFKGLRAVIKTSFKK